jgi:hypothetical protein
MFQSGFSPVRGLHSVRALKGLKASVAGVEVHSIVLKGLLATRFPALQGRKPAQPLLEAERAQQLSRHPQKGAAGVGRREIFRAAPQVCFGTRRVHVLG